MESELQPNEGSVQANPIPTMLYLAASNRSKAGLAPTSQLLQTTGLEPTHNVVNLTDAYEDGIEDLSSEVVHKMEAVPENQNDQPKDEEDQTEELNK